MKVNIVSNGIHQIIPGGQFGTVQWWKKSCWLSLGWIWLNHIQHPRFSLLHEVGMSQMSPGTYRWNLAHLRWTNIMWQLATQNYPASVLGGHPFYCLLSGENSLKAKTGFRLFFKVYCILQCLTLTEQKMSGLVGKLVYKIYDTIFYPNLPQIGVNIRNISNHYLVIGLGLVSFRKSLNFHSCLSRKLHAFRRIIISFWWMISDICIIYPNKPNWWSHSYCSNTPQVG